MIKSLKIAVCFLFVILFTLTSQAEFKVPKLSAPVVDKAGMLSSSAKGHINAALRKLKKSGGSQIQVLTVKDLSGLTIEQASIQVVDKWKLGDEEKDNGVLLLVAQKERRIRIEVGQGLEGSLTDAYSKRIIDEVMVPLFRSGDPGSGILLGILNIAKRTDPKVDFKSYLQGSNGFKSKVQKKKESSLISRVLSAIFYIFLFLLFLRNPMLFFLLLAGSGRRGGGGFGGGGGWSGGGGGFSGGGASGGW